MLFWIFSLLMLAAAVLCVLLPLSRRSQARSDANDAVVLYRRQLAEVTAEIEASGEESETLRSRKSEIARRILRHSRSDQKAETDVSQSKNLTKFASLASIVAIPVLAVGTYVYTGSPQLASFSQIENTTQPLAEKSVEEMVMLAERHLAKNPDDDRGWEVLANVYGRLNRPADKARALQELIRLSGPSAVRLADLGEALTIAAGNIVPAKARELFDQALVLQPEMPKASLFLAVALEQEGKYPEALDRWQRLQSVSTEDERWSAMTAARIAQLKSKMSEPTIAGPTASDIENAASLSQDDRNAMIEGMVQQLASKLEDEPDNFAGWQRLIRSYMVLKKYDEAKAAVQKALTQFGSDSEKVKLLESAKTQLEAQAAKEGSLNQ